jgi:hypothetical protein
LQYFHEEYQIFCEKYERNNSEKDSSKIQIDSTLAQQFDLIQLNKEHQYLTASIFDHLLEQYRDEEERNCDTIVDQVVKSLKKNSKRYIKEK